MTRAIDHVDVGNRVAITPEQGGEKPVQPVEIGQRQERVAAKHFQPTARVARAVAQDCAAHAVCDARLKFFGGAVAADALAGRKTDALAPCSKACKSAGMNEGSFCPSPSSVATIGARAAETPLRTAA